ncbi:acyltransferase family protein [Spirosoma spitsbergense]|uniref:acyltransferase family protein n=1 Tax=Spirosoma spitsbergense TaxID=431554 RepID=UPI0003749DAA
MIKNKIPQDKRLLLLDSLRGIAAIIVLYHHFFKINNIFFKAKCSSTIYSFLNFISGLNQEAVIFFFVLSGFCIGLSLKNKNLNDSEIINEYAYRRLKRLLPIYMMALVLTLFCGILMNNYYLEEYSLKNIAGNLMFLQTSDSIKSSWFTPYGFNGPLWSLAFEFFFYWFFLITFFLNSQYVFKLNMSVKILILLLLTILGVVVNSKFFFPHLLFFNSFIIWLLGYINSQYYLYNKKYNFIFLFILFFSSFYLLLGYRYVNSNTLIVVCKGLMMNSIFYYTLLYRRFLSRSFIIDSLNFLFYKIGKGSYAIYSLHYPLLLVLSYYDLNLYFQLFIIIIFTVLVIRLEELSLKWNFKFLRINYFHLVNFKKNYSE